MVISRRSVVATLTAAGALGAISGLARAQGFKARQYHPQPVTSHLHIYLTKLWDAVRAETDGRLDVTVYAQNNGVPIADPDILKLIQSGELEFFVLNGNILSQAHPVADIQGIPFAFATSEQVTSLTDGELGMFQHHFRVYDRAGQPCRTKGCGGTIRRIVQNGRSTFYCPVCQK